MKLAIVGGSSQSTPSLFLSPYLQLSPGSLSVVLIGRSQKRLYAVARAIDVVTQGRCDPETLVMDDEYSLRRTLSSVDMVLVQARYGGYKARSFDESFPVRYEVCGDEGLGPGGLASGWRSWPHLELLLSLIESACPLARVIIMSAPLGTLMRCALMRFSNLSIMGVCELPWTTLLSICDDVKADPKSVRFGYAGINHTGWLHHIYENGRDLVCEYSAKRSNSNEFPSSDVIDTCAAVPTKYLSLHYFPEVILGKQKQSRETRGQVLERLQSSAMSTFETGGYRDVLHALLQRPTPWYEHAVAPLVASVMGIKSEVIFFLTTINSNYMPHLGADEVLEIPYRISRGKLTQLPTGGSPSDTVMKTLNSYVEYERKAAEAILHRDFSMLESAMAIHPWIKSPNTAHRLAKEIETAWS